MRRRPDPVAIDDDRRHHRHFQRHSHTAFRGESLLWPQVAHAAEDQLSVLDAVEPHTSEVDVGGAMGIVGEDDLIRWKRHAPRVREEHKGTRWAVADDRET